MNGLPIISGLETATEKIRGAVDQHPSPLYEEQGGSVKQDDLVLNRLGKKPVLRVSSVASLLEVEWQSPCEIHFPCFQ